MVEYPGRLGSVFNASAFAAMRWCSRVRNQDRSDRASEHIFYALPYHFPPVLSDVALPCQRYAWDYQYVRLGTKVIEIPTVFYDASMSDL